MDEAQLEDFYKHRSEEKYPTSDNPENDAVIRKSLHELRLSDGQRLLDFGCADGYFIGKLKQACPGVEAYGVDLVAHDSWEHHPNVSFRAGDLPLPFEDNSFDAIFSSQVLEHVPDPTIAAAELARVLKPGGRMWIATPNGYNDTWRGFHGLQHRIDQVEGHYRHFSADDFVELFRPLNCDVINVRYDVFVCLYLYYRFVAYNPKLKKRLLTVVAPELVAANCRSGGSSENKNPSGAKRLAFAVLRGLRFIDERFSSSRRCQIIEVTVEKRRR